MDANFPIIERVVEATFEITQPLSFIFNVTQPLVIDMTSGVVQVTGDPWDGPYTITPHAYQQDFDTTDKLFVDDLTVLQIPTHQAPNTKGTTFTIDG